MNAIEIADRLSRLSEGLYFPSESEYPLEPFIWQATSLTPETILTQSGKPIDTPVEAIALEEFFAPTVKDEDWFEAEDRAIAQRFRDLQSAIAASLENVQVFKVGEIEIEVYIVGAIGNDLVGLRTKIIET